MKRAMVIGVLLALSVRMAGAGDGAFLPATVFLLGEEQPAILASYYTDLHPFLEADCSSGCHVGGAGGYLVNDNINVSYTSAIAEIELGIPEQSLLLRKPALVEIGHGGGKIPLYGENEANYNLILKWVVDGALLSEAGPAPMTYEDIHPLLEADCSSGCHSGGVGGYLVNDNLDNSYASAITKINLGSPGVSLLLYKPALLTNHGGGKIPLYGEDEVKYNLILKWVVDGALRR